MLAARMHELLRAGDIIGLAVIVFDADGGASESRGKVVAANGCAGAAAMRRVICPRSDRNGDPPSRVTATPSSEKPASNNQFGKENTMKRTTKSLLAGIVGVATVLSGCTQAQSQQSPVKNIVLV